MNYIFFISLILFSNLSLAAGKFIFIKGDVTIKRSNQIEKISKKNNKILINDIIKVGADSLALIKLNNKVSLKIEENTQLKVEKNESNSEETSVLLKAGALFVNFLNKNKKGTLNVKTRHAVMGVRGTRFFLSYGTNDEDTWMCVRNGLVEVKNNKGQIVKVKDGQGVKIQSQKLSDPKSLPWTKKLNWNFNPKKKLKNTVDISQAYSDPLGFEYD